MIITVLSPPTVSPGSLRSETPRRGKSSQRERWAKKVLKQISNARPDWGSRSGIGLDWEHKLSVPGSVPTSSTGLHDVHLRLGSQGWAVLVVQNLEEVLQLDHLLVLAFEVTF